MIPSKFKAQVLSDLETDGKVIIEKKYLYRIWQTEEFFAHWCEPWKLKYTFFQEKDITRLFCESLVRITWIEITRAETPTELTLLSDNLEEDIIINETDACI